MRNTVVILASLLLGLAACHDSDVSRTVGARCDGASECDERCLTAGHWPGGFCTVSCDGDLDCPEGSVCIKEDGGVCVFDCGIDRDCDFLEDGYRCKDVDHQAGGKVSVCRGD